jgi:DNA-binding transcriptional regulator YiaG
MSEGRTMDLEALGFTQEELQERVVDRCCSQVLSGVTYDEEGEEIDTDSAFARKLDEKIRAHIDSAVTAICDKHVLPLVTERIEGLVLQETNKWGEKVGEPVTFVEYLVKRAENYLTEKVTYDGKAPDHYSKATQTRITQMIDQHLHYHISTAMQQALTTANSAIVEGIQETVRLKLSEFAAALKVTVETKAKR